jgi:hypothetical protein
VDYLVPKVNTDVEVDEWIDVELREGEEVARPGAWGRFVRNNDVVW